MTIQRKVLGSACGINKMPVSLCLDAVSPRGFLH
jgi:hypothetical protein